MKDAAPAHASAARADRAAAAALLAFALFVIVEARSHPYWMVNAPGPGFLPLWLGVLLACASLVLFAATWRPARAARAPSAPEGEAAREDVRAGLDRPAAVRLAVVVALTAGAAALTPAAGFVSSSGLFMGAMLTYLRPGRAPANVAAAALTPLIVWLLFVRWLAVPLPLGPLGF